MGVITRRRIKENLGSVDVFLEDTQNEYFVVQDIPDTFTQGRATFKIFGSQLLKTGVPLKIEILDKAGETVYVQPIKFGSGPSPNLPYRYISVEVYKDINTGGEAELVILGELVTWVDFDDSDDDLCDYHGKPLLTDKELKKHNEKKWYPKAL